MARLIALAGVLALLIAAACAPNGSVDLTAQPDATPSIGPRPTQAATPGATPTASLHASPISSPSPGPPTSSPDTTQAVCAEQRAGQTADGEPVVICARTHAERPYVRPPADAVVQGGPSTLYLAALDPSYRGFIGRDGATYLPVGADRTPLSADELLSSLRAPSNRHLYMVYHVRGVVDLNLIHDDGGRTFTASIQIEEAAPAILIEGRAIDGAFLGPWEGTVSERVDEAACVLTVPCWDEARLVPLRVSFTELEQIENISVLDPGDGLLPDGDRFALRGAIENLVDAVMGSEGTCIDPLALLDDANPFRPSMDGDLTLYRYPAMHAPGDDELVLDYPLATEGLGGANGMSPLTVLHPANLMLEEEDQGWNSISIHNHGVPNGSEINLRPVAGGGGTCTP